MTDRIRERPVPPGTDHCDVDTLGRHEAPHSTHAGPAPATPTTVIDRTTWETTVHVELARGTGHAAVDTGRPFLDHMLVTLARYAALDLVVCARGDLAHHVIEDVAIATGTALLRVAGPSIARFGDRTIPMDDALVHVALDLGDRPYYLGPLPGTLYDHWMRSFAHQARATLHVRVLRGRDYHHVVEAAFKALGLAMRDALADAGAVLSTKGPVVLGARPARGDQPA